MAALAVRGLEADLPAPHYAAPDRVADVVSGARPLLLHVPERGASPEGGPLDTAPAGSRARPVAAHPARAIAAEAVVTARARRAGHQPAAPRPVAGRAPPATLRVRARRARHTHPSRARPVALDAEPLAAAPAADLVDAESADAVRVGPAALSEQTPAASLPVAAVATAAGVGVGGEAHLDAEPGQAGHGAAPARLLARLGAADGVPAVSAHAFGAAAASGAGARTAHPLRVAATLTGAGVGVHGLRHDAAHAFPSGEGTAPAFSVAGLGATDTVAAAALGAAAILHAGLSPRRLRQAHAAQAVVPLEAVLLRFAACGAAIGARTLEGVARAHPARQAAPCAVAHSGVGLHGALTRGRRADGPGGRRIALAAEGFGGADALTRRGPAGVEIAAAGLTNPEVLVDLAVAVLVDAVAEGLPVRRLHAGVAGVGGAVRVDVRLLGVVVLGAAVEGVLDAVAVAVALRPAARRLNMGAHPVAVADARGAGVTVEARGVFRAVRARGHARAAGARVAAPAVPLLLAAAGADRALPRAGRAPAVAEAHPGAAALSVAAAREQDEAPAALIAATARSARPQRRPVGADGGAERLGGLGVAGHHPREAVPARRLPAGTPGAEVLVRVAVAVVVLAVAALRRGHAAVRRAARGVLEELGAWAAEAVAARAAVDRAVAPGLRSLGGLGARAAAVAAEGPAVLGAEIRAAVGGLAGAVSAAPEGAVHEAGEWALSRLAGAVAAGRPAVLEALPRTLTTQRAPAQAVPAAPAAVLGAAPRPLSARRADAVTARVAVAGAAVDVLAAVRGADAVSAGAAGGQPFVDPSVAVVVGSVADLLCRRPRAARSPPGPPGADLLSPAGPVLVGALAARLAPLRRRRAAAGAPSRRADLAALLTLREATRRTREAPRAAPRGRAAVEQADATTSLSAQLPVHDAGRQRPALLRAVARRAHRRRHRHAQEDGVGAEPHDRRTGPPARAALEARVAADADLLSGHSRTPPARAVLVAAAGVPDLPRGRDVDRARALVPGIGRARVLEGLRPRVP